MDFNKLRQKKKDNWTVWVTLNDGNESITPLYVPKVSDIENLTDDDRDIIIMRHVVKQYGDSGWLAFKPEFNVFETTPDDIPRRLETDEELELRIEKEAEFKNKMMERELAQLRNLKEKYNQ